MFCDQCGFENPDQAEFCSDCGGKMATLSDNFQIQNYSMPEPIFRAPSARPRKKLPLILGILAAVVIVIVALGFIFKMQITKAVSPQSYLQMAMAQTFTGSQTDLLSQLNLAQFDNKATSQVFSVESNQNSYSDFSVDGELQLDVQNEKALLNLSYEDNYYQYSDNQLFVSPALIAGSLPDFDLDETFLTIDPATINEMWTENGWDGFMALPNIQDIIKSLFGKGGVKPQYEKLMFEYQKIADELMQDVEFSVGKSKKATIGRQSYQLDVMSYTIPEKSFNRFIEDYFALCIDLYRDEYSAMYGQDIPATIEQYLTSLEMSTDIYSVNDDITLEFYIDQGGMIRKIVAAGLAFDPYGTGKSELDVQVEIELGGKASPTDTIEAVITADTSYETYVITLNREAVIKNGVLTDEIKIEFTSDNGYYDLSGELVFEWDMNDQTGDNLQVELTFDSSYGSSPAVNLSGQLTREAGQISLQDATLELVNVFYETVQIDFSFTLQQMKTPISMNTEDAVPLLEFDQFVDYMDNGLESINYSKAYSLFNAVNNALSYGANLSSVSAGTNFEEMDSDVVDYYWYPIQRSDTFGYTIIDGNVASATVNGQKYTSYNYYD